MGFPVWCMGSRAWGGPSAVPCWPCATQLSSYEVLPADDRGKTAHRPPPVGVVLDMQGLSTKKSQTVFSKPCFSEWRVSGVRKRVVSKRVVSADVPPERNRNEGTFAKTTLLETALLSPSEPFWCWQKGGFQKGGFGGCSPERKPERGYVRQNHPFTKPPFYLSVSVQSVSICKGRWHQDAWNASVWGISPPSEGGLPLFGGCQKGGFPKGWFWRMLPRNENRKEGIFGCSPRTKTGTRVYVCMFPRNENRNKGTFAKTTLNYETARFSPSDQSRFLGRGCDEALFSEKSVFQWKGGRQFSEWGFGKDFYRKGNSVKRFGPFTEPPDSENWKVAVLIPFPKISSKWSVASWGQESEKHRLQALGSMISQENLVTHAIAITNR